MSYPAPTAEELPSTVDSRAS